MKNQTTSNRLKLALNLKGLKQADVLRLCEPYCKQYNIKMGSNDLSQYINGKTKPKQDKLTVLGLALNINEAWLMGFDVPMARGNIEKKNKLIDMINNSSITDEEADDIINFISFVISKRNK